jgi:hypothetical protein
VSGYDGGRCGCPYQGVWQYVRSIDRKLT